VLKSNYSNLVPLGTPRRGGPVALRGRMASERSESASSEDSTNHQTLLVYIKIRMYNFKKHALFSPQFSRLFTAIPSSFHRELWWKEEGNRGGKRRGIAVERGGESR
jgi:hypothetical protein